MAVRAVERKPAHRKPTKDGGGSFATVNSRRGFFRCRSAPNDEPHEARFVTSMNGSELQLKVRSRGCDKKADIAKVCRSQTSEPVGCCNSLARTGEGGLALGSRVLQCGQSAESTDEPPARWNWNSGQLYSGTVTPTPAFLTHQLGVLTGRATLPPTPAC